MTPERQSSYEPGRGQSCERPDSAKTTSALCERELGHTESEGRIMLTSAVPLPNILPGNLRIEPDSSSVTNSMTTDSANTSTYGSGEVVVSSRPMAMEDGTLKKGQKRSLSPVHRAAKKHKLGNAGIPASTHEYGPDPYDGEHNLGESFPCSETGSPAPEQVPTAQPAAKKGQNTLEDGDADDQHRNSVGPTTVLQLCNTSQNPSPQASEKLGRKACPALRKPFILQSYCWLRN